MALRFRMLCRKLCASAKRLTPPQIIALVFLGIVLSGALLLTLPVCAGSGKSTPLLTALFTATSCTCVTGLSLVDSFTHWSVAGQAVMLVLIQIGGLGFMTIMSLFFFAMRRKISLKERLVIAQSFGIEKLSGLVKMVRKVLLRTLVIEGCGALILTIRFSLQMPIGRAVWYGVFHSVSAFCNAGFDLFGAVEQGGSLVNFVSDPVVNFTLMALILNGGLGFFVWEDIARSRSFRKLSVYTKLVLLMTAILTIGGAALIALCEWNNPASMGGLTAGEKLLASLFQSVTTRTAGFYTIPQGALTDATMALSELLMFIGGGSGSTAGGAKMVTICVLLLSVLSTARGSSHVTVLRRSVGEGQIRNAVAVAVMMFALAFGSGILISALNAQPLKYCMYETVSAIATVGLSVGISAQLSALSQLILIVLMFFGRVGIMTISLGFLFANGAKERYRYAETKLLIG